VTTLLYRLGLVVDRFVSTLTLGYHWG